MLEITAKVVTLTPEEVLELERIVTDGDEKASFVFVKKSIYRKLVRSKENRLKSHLDGDPDPTGSFAAKNK